jgi:predicted nucleotidyltransferase
LIRRNESILHEVFQRFNDEASGEKQKMAAKNCALLVRCGSNLYGTAGPESDDDYVGFFMVDEQYTLGLDGVETVEFKTNSSDSGKRNGKGDLDCTLHSLHKFLKLLLNNNPNMLELLFAPENCLVHANEYGKAVMEASNLFVSLKCYHSFRGYVHEQQRRLGAGLSSGNNSGRRDLIEKFGYDVKMASHVLRLNIEACELLKTGRVSFPLKENQLVRDVKYGNWPGEEGLAKFHKKADHLGEMLDLVYASSELPHDPNRSEASKLCTDLYRKFYKI